MEYLAQDKRVVFMGQAVAVPGTAMSNTLKNVDKDQLVELPVTEELQLGMATGMNFVLLAVSQLVNHLDKLPLMSNGGYKPHVIIRTGIGSERPLHPQFQHVGDFSEAFQLMCVNTEVLRLDEPEMIFPSYQKALERTDGKTTLLVEYGDYYNEK